MIRIINSSKFIQMFWGLLAIFLITWIFDVYLLILAK